MSLLKRIALSQGNQQRKNAATDLLRQQDAAQIKAWHQQLEAEIRHKQGKERPQTCAASGG